MSHVRGRFLTCLLQPFKSYNFRPNTIDMSVKHLGKDSQEIPPVDGKLRLYSNRFCPYAHRIHLILYAKDIEHDFVNIDLHNKPGWFLEKYAAGKVPALYVNGETIYESLILADFLEEKYPQRPLWPKDPLCKAKDRLVIDEFAKLTRLFFKLYHNTAEPEDIVAIQDKTHHFERELSNRGTLYFSGNEPGMLDYMIWPWAERVDMDSLLGGDRQRFQTYFRWIEAMREDPAVKKHYCTVEQHTKFFITYRDGAPNYDNILGLERKK